jgi:hypothetical protein
MAFYARGIDWGAIAFLIALDHNASYGSPNLSRIENHSLCPTSERDTVSEAYAMSKSRR